MIVAVWLDSAAKLFAPLSFSADLRLSEFCSAECSAKRFLDLNSASSVC